MSKTPRQYKDVAGNPVSLDWLVRHEPEWAANQIRHRDQLETELAEAKETIRLLTTDVNYVGGIQYWQKQHHEALVAGFLALRQARAAAFDEAADIAYNNGDYATARYISAKANRIRKGEEK